MTIKITLASKINVVSPTNILIPLEEADGNYNVVVEASDDLKGWMPFFSQTVSSATAKKFYRARITKAEAP